MQFFSPVLTGRSCSVLCHVFSSLLTCSWLTVSHLFAWSSCAFLSFPCLLQLVFAVFVFIVPFPEFSWLCVNIQGDQLIWSLMFKVDVNLSSWLVTASFYALCCYMICYLDNFVNVQVYLIKWTISEIHIITSPGLSG